MKYFVLILIRKPQVKPAGFVFGEKLDDRVINSAVLESEAKENAKEENGTISKLSTTLPGGYDIESDRYSLENDSNTLLKLNCKLFMLCDDKINWQERGYGILKIFDSNDGYNCRISTLTNIS